MNIRGGKGSMGLKAGLSIGIAGRPGARARIWLVLAVFALTLSFLLAGAGFAAARAPQLPAAGGTLWMTNEVNNAVTVYDGARGSLIASITVGTKPVGLAALPEFDKVYVANEVSGNVSVISTKSLSVVATISLVTSTFPNPKPHDIWMSADGSRVYVSEFGHNMVALIDTATDSLVTRFTVGSSTATTHGVWLPAVGSVLYATNFGDNTLAALDPSSGALLWSFATDARPTHLVTTEDGEIGFLSIGGTGVVDVLDLQTPALLRTIPVGTSPASLWLSPNERWLIVANSAAGSTSVSIVDLSAGWDARSVDVGAKPNHVTISQNSQYAFVAVTGLTPHIAVINLATMTVVASYPATGTPHGLFYMPMRMG